MDPALSRITANTREIDIWITLELRWGSPAKIFVQYKDLGRVFLKDKGFALLSEGFSVEQKTKI